MSAWGTSLYSNDTTCDIRGVYVDRLKRGKTNEEVTQELIEENRDIFGDVEEEPLFWYALADTQWNYGRLLPFVKEKALYFLSQTDELERWKEAGPKMYNAWLATLTKLRDKLNSPVPPEKRVSKYRLYKCGWKLGDVFAYQFSGEYSKEHNCFGKYIVIRKVSETDFWPGHIIPVFTVYKWMGEEIPPLEDIVSKELLPLGYIPSKQRKCLNEEYSYLVAMITNSAKDIPQNNLTYLGNVPGEDLIQCIELLGSSLSIDSWETQKRYHSKMEDHVIKKYFEWCSIE